MNKNAYLKSYLTYFILNYPNYSIFSKLSILYNNNDNNHVKYI
jgi:hypothetical protein